MTRARRRAMGVAAVMAVCGLLLSACGSTGPVTTLPGPDHRAPLALSGDDARQLRRGMRIFLESVQGIIEGANQHDMAQVARSAERSGMGMIEDLSISDALKLPPEFVVMSIDTHQKFDALARTAKEGGGRKRVMDELQGILGNCTTCHATYRLTR